MTEENDVLRIGDEYCLDRENNTIPQFLSTVY